MTDTDNVEKVHENRVRRMAKRQGLELVKSRRRDPRALDYGGYLLRDPFNNTLVYGYGYNSFGARLADVEKWLEGEHADSAS